MSRAEKLEIGAPMRSHMHGWGRKLEIGVPMRSHMHGWGRKLEGGAPMCVVGGTEFDTMRLARRMDVRPEAGAAKECLEGAGPRENV